MASRNAKRLKKVPEKFKDNGFVPEGSRCESKYTSSLYACLCRPILAGMYLKWRLDTSCN